MSFPHPWDFNADVSTYYDEHVSKHIPLYAKTIDACLSFADKLAFTDPILDFGCATGCTLRKFQKRGFTSLWGVDCAPQMYQAWDEGFVHYSTQTINQQYSLTLSNWTLHFCKDKWEILSTLVEHSDYLILSDKTTESLARQSEYDNWKLAQGCTREEIEEKKKSLEGIMHLHTVEEYMNRLNRPSSILHHDLGFYTLLVDCR